MLASDDDDDVRPPKKLWYEKLKHENETVSTNKNKRNKVLVFFHFF